MLVFALHTYIHTYIHTQGTPYQVLREKFLKIKTGHLFSIAKLNFESICFLAFFDLRPFKLVHRHLKFLAFLHSENEVKICKIDKMAKNHFLRAEKGFFRTISLPSPHPLMTWSTTRPHQSLAVLHSLFSLPGLHFLKLFTYENSVEK